jgi:hypothetical protein
MSVDIEDLFINQARLLCPLCGSSEIECDSVNLARDGVRAITLHFNCKSCNGCAELLLTATRSDKGYDETIIDWRTRRIPEFHTEVYFCTQHPHPLE